MNENQRPALQRRSTVRLDAEIELDLHSDHNFYTGFSANISDGGLFVATYRPQSVGDRLNVKFKLPGVDEPIEAKVEVRWVRDARAGDDTAPGFGATFVELSDHGRALVERYLDKREPLFFEE